MVYLRRTAKGNEQYDLNGTGAWKEVHLPGRARHNSVAPAAEATQLQVSYTEMLEEARRTSGAMESDPPSQRDCEASNVKENLRNMVLRFSFDSADKNGDGTLSKSEFGLFLRRALPDVANKIINQAFAAADTNTDSAVTFPEFMKWMRNEEQQSIVDALNESVGSHGNAMAALFRVWDTDESGKISQNELREVVKHVCPKMGDDELDIVFQAMDSDHDGTIDYNEFIGFVGLSDR